MADPAGDGSGICTSSESVEEKNKEAVDDHQFESSSCSPSSDNKIDNHSFSKKPRLFGRQKSVHVVLGGGKWEDMRGDFVVLVTLLLIKMLVNKDSLFSFDIHPLKFPEFEMPEDLLVRIALLLRDQLNLAIATFREVALGKDLKKFLYVSSPPEIYVSTSKA
ncbi:hypothetical protein HYC85_007394 [Camellia sinensis]|uniref:Reticulon domain-containing protein n=1 Tax=Camellia sinensis TaxID=4442 RepID=A0A7J7HRA4_CAMSI|nr:hypothetical protein HYC85_007394 [Camellia sinensis]